MQRTRNVVARAICLFDKGNPQRSLLAGEYSTALAYLDCQKSHMVHIGWPKGASGSGSVVEHLLAKEGVASSNLVFRSIFFGDVAKWLRRGSAKPLSPVRFRPS